MKPENQQIAIAVACGFKFKEEYIYGKEVSSEKWTRISFPDGNECCTKWPREKIPDYLNDLNTIAEARRAILTTAYLRVVFIESLHKIGAHYDPAVSGWHLVDAPANVQARALLETIGKWTEE